MVIPVKAGIPLFDRGAISKSSVPAVAGTTQRECMNVAIHPRALD